MRAVGGVAEPARRFCAGFPRHVAPRDIALKLAGAGGDGAQTAAMLIAQAGPDLALRHRIVRYWDWQFPQDGEGELTGSDFAAYRNVGNWLGRMKELRSWNQK